MESKWTFMVYMAGNNSLSGAASADLSEMRKVGSTPAVQVAAFVKQQGKDAVQRIVAKKEDADVVTALPSDTDSGSPQTVLDFARWAVAKAPAKRYALVLWNHGGGWAPLDLDQLYQQVRAGNGARHHEVNRLASRKIRRTVFTPSVKAILSRKTAVERAICSDDVSGHSLDTVEVGRVLSKLSSEIGAPIDLFGMDACLMSTLEVAFEVRAQARTVVGSEELEPGAGWDYQAILQALNAKPDMDGPALAKVIVQSYVDSYQSSQAEWPVTQCAVDTSKCEAFSGTLDKLANALRPKLPSIWSDVLKAQARAASFEFEMVDLRTLCRGLSDRISEAPIKAAAQGVLDALAPGDYVLAQGHLGPKVADCGGVSIYLPSPIESQVSPYYGDLALSKQHHWDELLADYSRAVKQ